MKTIKKNESPHKNSFTGLKEIKEITSKMAIEIEKKIELINRNDDIYKAKSTPKFNAYQKYKNYLNLTNYSTNKEIKKIDEKKERLNEEHKKLNTYTKLIKDSKFELSNIKHNEVNKERNKFSKQKSFLEDFALPNDIKKECKKELSKLDDKDKKGRKDKENIQLNVELSDTSRDKKKAINKTLDNIIKGKNKSRKEKNSLKMENIEKLEEFFKDNKNYNVGIQKKYYKEYLYGSENNNYNNYLNEKYLSENNTKFLPYYKENFE